ncbi:hypothetical protein EVAR_18138_1, partial [Eumeta japonica]
ISRAGSRSEAPIKHLNPEGEGIEVSCIVSSNFVRPTQPGRPRTCPSPESARGEKFVKGAPPGPGIVKVPHDEARALRCEKAKQFAHQRPAGPCNCTPAGWRPWARTPRTPTNFGCRVLLLTRGIELIKAKQSKGAQIRSLLVDNEECRYSPRGSISHPRRRIGWVQMRDNIITLYLLTSELVSRRISFRAPARVECDQEMCLCGFEVIAFLCRCTSIIVNAPERGGTSASLSKVNNILRYPRGVWRTTETLCLETTPHH